jgi:hypothetical protein
MNEAVKNASEKSQSSDMWRTMYNRMVQHFPDKQAQIIGQAAEIEQLSRENENSEDTQTGNKLNMVVSKLNEENMSLKLELETLHQANKVDKEKLQNVENENQSLKNELNTIKETRVNELKSRDKELEVLKLRVKQHESIRQELMQKHSNEMNAANIRFENELNIENELMQRKCNSLIREANIFNLFWRVFLLTNGQFFKF